MNLAEFTAALRDRAGVARVRIDPLIEAPLYRYFDLLRRWNKTINLTALPLDTPADDTIDRLVVEPLAIASKIPNKPLSWLDLGSGGGSPAVPIAVARPALRLTMVESRSRKAAFLREVVRELALSNAQVENVRFEALRDRTDLAGSADLITLRAVRIDDELVALLRRLLHSGGYLAAIGTGTRKLPGFDRDGETGLLVRRCST